MYPEQLVENCLQAGCPPHGVVLDPFLGSGTTAVVARRLERDFVGIDCVPAYCRMAEERLQRTLTRLPRWSGAWTRPAHTFLRRTSPVTVSS